MGDKSTSLADPHYLPEGWTMPERVKPGFTIDLEPGEPHFIVTIGYRLPVGIAARKMCGPSLKVSADGTVGLSPSDIEAGWKVVSVRSERVADSGEPVEGV